MLCNGTWLMYLRKGCGKATGKRNARSGWELCELLYHMRNSMAGVYKRTWYLSPSLKWQAWLWWRNEECSLRLPFVFLRHEFTNSCVICRNGISNTGIYLVQCSSETTFEIFFLCVWKYSTKINNSFGHLKASLVKRRYSSTWASWRSLPKVYMKRFPRILVSCSLAGAGEAESV